MNASKQIAMYPFRMSSGTATILVIDPDRRAHYNSRLLIGVRGKNVQVHPGKPSLPGGFMEAKYKQTQKGFLASLWSLIQETFSDSRVEYTEHDDHPGETLEQAAIRELKEEIGVDFDINQLHQYYTCSEPGLDPRAHVINLCFWLVATPEQIAAITAGDDLDSVEWLRVGDFMMDQDDFQSRMAFNHADLTVRGIRHYIDQQKLDYIKEQEAEPYDCR